MTPVLKTCHLLWLYALTFRLSAQNSYLKAMKLQRSYLADFASLLFPKLCCACGESLMGSEKLICTDCLYNLPYTHFHQQPDNIVARQFWGRLPISNAYAMLYFTKGGKVQQLMHHFKYQNMPHIGHMLGQMTGHQLILNDGFKQIDAIIPVPLHKSKLRKRGYNQSECFANGVAEILKAPVITDNLLRKSKTETQTHKSRFERAENMQNVFTLTDARALANQHLLLVDDVVTTGSTLEACGIALQDIPGVKLSIATIAYAE
jgi:ComF family protein